jgi:hypothetical protein
MLTPHVDVSLRTDMTPGDRIYAQAGMFFWPGPRPIGPSDQPHTAATTITRTLHTRATWPESSSVAGGPQR